MSDESPGKGSLGEMRPAGWGVLAAGSCVSIIGLIVGHIDLIAVGLAALISVASGVIYARRRIGLELWHEVQPKQVEVGTPVTLRLGVRNATSRRSPAVVAEDYIGGNRINFRLPALPASRSDTDERQVETLRRGRYQIGPVELRRQDPLGFYRTAVTDDSAPDELIVFPPLHRLEVPHTGLRIDPDGQTSETSPQGSESFHGLRQYQRGDDRRHIHWRTSARLRTYYVKHFVDIWRPDAVIYVDNRAEVFDDDSFENAIEFATSFVAATTRAQYPTRLVVAARGPEAPGLAPVPLEQGSTNSVMTLGPFMETLAAAELAEVDDPDLAQRRLGTAPAAQSLVVVTGRANRRDVAQWAGFRARFGEVFVVRSTESTPESAHGDAILVDGTTIAELVDNWNRVVA